MSKMPEDFFEDIDLDVEELDYRPDDKYLISKVINGSLVPKDGLIFDNHKRYYLEDLTQRDFLLENTTPYQIFLFDTIIEDNSWGILLKKVALLMLEKCPEKESSILDFRCDWTKAEMFSTIVKTNFKELKENLFINTNHTALHSCWLLQDLMAFFDVDASKVIFLIHRTPGAENSKIKDSIRNNFIEEFSKYIVDNLKKDEHYANTVVKYISTYLNPILSSISKSYPDLFLFDNTAVMYGYIKKVRSKIENSTYKDNSKKTLNTCLDILVDYYKKAKY